jgi:hypothetical protein
VFSDFRRSLERPPEAPLPPPDLGGLGWTAAKWPEAAQAGPRSPDEEAKRFALPDGFTAELVLAESEAADDPYGKFVALAFDARGRLWTTTAVEYPLDGNENPEASRRLFESGGRDKVLVVDKPFGRKPAAARVFADGLAATVRFGALLPPKTERPVAQHDAVLEQVYGAPEARQGVAVDATHFYAVVNTVIGKYERATGRLVARWAGPRGGLIRHLNSCTVVTSQLMCAHSNHPEVPHGSSVEIFDTATLNHIGSVSLGNRDEGSLTIVEPMGDGWLLGFAHYSDATGVPFKGHDYSQLISTDSEWRRREGWLIPPAIRKRMAPQAASGGAIGNDGLLYLFGHTLPEMYVLARPKSGAELIHVATIKIAVEGQAFTFDPTDARRIFAIDRPSGTVRVFKLPTIGELPNDAKLFERGPPVARRSKSTTKLGSL